MIQIKLVFANGHATLVAKPTTSETVDVVEFAMRASMANIRGIAVIAHGADMEEGERVRQYLYDVDMDLRVKTALDRQMPDLIGVYELANYPRRKEIR